MELYAFNRMVLLDAVQPMAVEDKKADGVLGSLQECLDSHGASRREVQSSLSPVGPASRGPGYAPVNPSLEHLLTPEELAQWKLFDARLKTASQLARQGGGMHLEHYYHLVGQGQGQGQVGLGHEPLHEPNTVLGLTQRQDPLQQLMKSKSFAKALEKSSSSARPSMTGAPEGQQAGLAQPQPQPQVQPEALLSPRGPMHGRRAQMGECTSQGHGLGKSRSLKEASSPASSPTSGSRHISPSRLSQPASPRASSTMIPALPAAASPAPGVCQVQLMLDGAPMVTFDDGTLHTSSPKHGRRSLHNRSTIKRSTSGGLANDAEHADVYPSRRVSRSGSLRLHPPPRRSGARVSHTGDDASSPLSAGLPVPCSSAAAYHSLMQDDSAAKHEFKRLLGSAPRVARASMSGGGGGGGVLLMYRGSTSGTSPLCPSSAKEGASAAGAAARQGSGSVHGSAAGAGSDSGSAEAAAAGHAEDDLLQRVRGMEVPPRRSSCSGNGASFGIPSAMAVPSSYQRATASCSNLVGMQHAPRAALPGAGGLPPLSRMSRSEAGGLLPKSRRATESG